MLTRYISEVINGIKVWGSLVSRTTPWRHSNWCNVTGRIVLLKAVTVIVEDLQWGSIPSLHRCRDGWYVKKYRPHYHKDSVFSCKKLPKCFHQLVFPQCILVSSHSRNNDAHISAGYLSDHFLLKEKVRVIWFFIGTRSISDVHVSIENAFGNGHCFA